MARYFNRGRGNLPLTLRDGRSVSVPGNSWIELSGADETTAAVVRAVRKGLLFRQPTPEVETAPAVSPPSAPVLEEAKTPAPAGEETRPATAAGESKPRRAASKF